LPSGAESVAPPFAEPGPQSAGLSDSLWPESLHTGASPHSTLWGWTQLDAAGEAASAAQAMRPSFHLCHPALAWRALLGVQVLVAVGQLLTTPSTLDLPAWGALAFSALVATGAWLAVLCLGADTLRRMGRAAAAAVAVGWGALLAPTVAWPMQWAAVFSEASSAQWLGLCLTGALVAGWLWAWLEARAHRSQPAEARARLAELQSRIRPHFLFNALNTAAALVRVDPVRAETVLEDLSELFREALSETSTSVSLREEVLLAQRYLAIESVRFGSRLHTEWAIDERAASARLPPLVLQPLVENAVRHGIEPSRSGGLVRVAASVVRGQAVLLVSSPVEEEAMPPAAEAVFSRGAQPKARRAAGHGMALANVRERLLLLHDVAASLDTWREGGRFHARIVVPL
jgi:two-component system sensor histidine kinase AlgZ